MKLDQNIGVSKGKGGNYIYNHVTATDSKSARQSSQLIGTNVTSKLAATDRTGDSPCASIKRTSNSLVSEGTSQKIVIKLNTHLPG